ncbi:MAG: PAS domain-containing protein [Alphaproteobacteria bacterium]|nr:PAS domain-containing protein [Alphaproteobacteria bacterium]
MGGPTDKDTARWHTKVRQLYDYWKRLHPADGVLPGRQHFDPLDIAELMPLVWMVDIIRDQPAPRFRYRLLGTRHVRAMTRDDTGRWMDEAHDDFRNSAVYPHYLDVARGEVSWRRGRPGFHVDPNYYEIERVMLPMARNPAVVDMILAITVYFDRKGNVV